MNRSYFRQKKNCMYSKFIFCFENSPFLFKNTFELKYNAVTKVLFDAPKELSQKKKILLTAFFKHFWRNFVIYSGCEILASAPWHPMAWTDQLTSPADMNLSYESPACPFLLGIWCLYARERERDRERDRRKIYSIWVSAPEIKIFARNFSMQFIMRW